MCWFWGPYMLYCARKVEDTHFWSFQTKVNLIAGCVDFQGSSQLQADTYTRRLPGTPLWLTFLYSNHPTIIEINRWFPHAGW